MVANGFPTSDLIDAFSLTWCRLPRLGRIHTIAEVAKDEDQFRPCARIDDARILGQNRMCMLSANVLLHVSRFCLHVLSRMVSSTKGLELMRFNYSCLSRIFYKILVRQLG